jgi:hypothetical protein
VALGGAVVTGWTLVALTFGPDTSRNPAPYVVFVWLWVGLAALSLLFGPVWTVLNPVRWLHLGICRALQIDPDEPATPYRMGYWPAAFGLVVFSWLELIAPNRTTSIVLGIAIAVFIAVDLAGAIVYGRQWFGRADPFEVMSRLFGSLSPLGRGRRGGWVLRSSLAGLDAIPVAPGLLATVVVLLAGTVYDGLTGVPAWFAIVQSSASPLLLQTGTLLVVGVLVGVALWAASPAHQEPGGLSRLGKASMFAPCLVPVAAGYMIAHYWSLGAYGGVYGLTLMTDPLGTGADLLHTASLSPPASLVTPQLVAGIQALGIVVGHLLGVVYAHERAMQLGDRGVPIRGQLPMLSVMVAYTCGGLLLLFSG